MTIDVLVEAGVKQNDGIFTYSVPQELTHKIDVGLRVLVPFGTRKIEGFILNIYQDKVYEYELKNIYSVIDEHRILNDEMLNLGQYMKETYSSSLIKSYQVMLPKALKAKQSSTVSIKEDKYVELNKDENIIKAHLINNKQAPKQNELLTKLLLNKKLKKTLFDNSVVNRLIEKDLIKITFEEVNRLYSKEYEETLNKKLTSDQQLVFDSINLNKKETYLLHGVTGSGKTEIYMQLIEEVLNNQKEAIVLVPEISLTPQMINHFKGRFKNNIALIHSRLSDGERFDEYRRIISGEAKIVIGARSAIFAPLTNIGLIVIDEEHEATYKQESDPRYNAIDIALKRSEHHNCPVLLGSATPSLESYARATKKVYTLLELRHRINDLRMPKIELVNMLNEFKKRNFMFSDLLRSKIIDRLNKNEQIILLLNRRGYSNYLICTTCGYIHKCPNCDISLTYHKTSNNLKCHYCGYQEKHIETCPSCKQNTIKNMGLGTQQVEEELIKTFNAKVIRMDLDTTSKKGSHERILEDFKTHKYDILLGTQMIAKGLDFDSVTLVGVLNGDSSLNIPDFRSSERTFQLISQVSGRSGRKIPGEVVIQSYNTDHYSIIAAKNHDYKSFYNYEMNIRRNLKYPPFYYLSLIKISGKDYELVYNEAKKVKQYLVNNLTQTTVILGPTAANVYKINNVYRFQIIIKYKKDDHLKPTINKIVDIYKENNKVNIDIDVNPLRL